MWALVGRETGCDGQCDSLLHSNRDFSQIIRSLFSTETAPCKSTKSTSVLHVTVSDDTGTSSLTYSIFGGLKGSMLGQLARKTLGCLLGQIAFHFSVKLVSPFLSFVNCAHVSVFMFVFLCLCVYVCVYVHILAYVCLDVFSICLCVSVFLSFCMSFSNKGLFCSMLWTFFLTSLWYQGQLYLSCFPSYPPPLSFHLTD